MDASAIVSIVISLFSVAISIYLGVTALKISDKSDTTLAVIKTEINALRGDFMKRFEQAQTDYQEVIKIVVAEKVHRGEWSNEQAEDFEEEFKEAIKVLRRPSPDPTSILSKQSKLGK